MKKSYPDKFSLAIAIILSLGFYTLLFFLFRFHIRVVEVNKKPLRRLADVMMLPLEKNPVLPWQKNLIASLELLDPTIMSLPNSSYGFSNVRSLEFERPLKPLTPYQMMMELTTPPSSPSLLPTPPIDDLLFAINQKNRLERNVSHGKSTTVGLDSVVYWTNGEGDIQERFPKISLDEFTEEGQKLTTLGPTQLQVSNRKDVVRIKVLNSCGNPRLDKMAVDSLRRYYTKEQAKVSPDVADNEGPKKIATIFAYWRFADQVDETPNIDIKENLRDWDRF